MPKALLIVDVQPTFCEGGALPVAGGNAVARRVAQYAAKQADDYELIVTTQDWHVDPGNHFSDAPDFVDTWPPHGVAGTDEAQLHDALSATRIDHRVRKGAYEAAYSGFEGVDEAGRPLADLLRGRGVDEVHVVGLALSHCVKETALDAKRQDWLDKVVVFEDLTEPVTPEQGVAAVEELRRAGVDVRTTRH